MALSRFILPIALAMIVALLSGCASKSYRGRHQYVHVPTEPSESKIEFQGKQIESRSGLIYLPRAREAKIVVTHGNQRREVQLSSRYRWKESFLPNLVFLFGAPIGWAVDHFSGAAYDLEDPQPVRFAKETSADSPVVAIAPPLAPTFALSDEAAEYFSAKLAPKNQVRNFKQSLRVFQESGFDFDSVPTDIQSKREVLYHLDADQVFLSSVQMTPDGVIYRGSSQNLYGVPVPGTEIESKNIVGHAPAVLPQFSEWFHLLPNTIGVEAVNRNFYAEVDGTSRQAANVKNDSAILNALSYFDSLSLTHLVRPRPNGSSRGTFNFLPSLRSSYLNVFFPDEPRLANVEFEYVQLAVGYGVEGGVQFGKNFAYIRYIPMLGWHQLKWTQPEGTRESETSVLSQVHVEFGYIYFLDSKLSARVFFKSINTSNELWTIAAKKVNPTITSAGSSTESLVGISLGYTFPDFAR